MKKLTLLLALAAIMMVGCTEQEKTNYTRYKIKSCNAICVIIDSCEYIVNEEKYAFAHGAARYETYTHKGNCKYCDERKKKELEELAIKLKEE